MKECPPQLLDEIVRRLVAALHPLRIYLFGSHVAAEADRDSDLDLLVVVPDTPTSPRELARLGRGSLWGMAVPVDLVVCTDSEMRKWAPVPCNLIHTVVQRGRLVYGTAA
ncbi:nucleotidyltransferase domain-containing protein [bacterium]|nr:nucleotidyltransferase domain-containing protein [bacterium]